MRLNRRDTPGRGLEMPFYTFDLVGDYGIYRDLQRHRMLTQERQLLSTSYGYEKPEEIEEAGLGSIFDDAMLQAAEVYENLQKDFPHEAQYVVPMGYRIRCNSVHPDPIRTDMGNELMELKGYIEGPDIETNWQTARKRVPIGETGEPIDDAQCILFLASDESRHVTGSELVVDGGLTAT